MTAYKRLTLYDRKKIEEGLDAGLSFRAIADAIGKSPSTVSREVKENRSSRPSGRINKVRCRVQNHCSERKLCKVCPHPHAVCVECKRVDCRDVCAAYALQISCLRVATSPWVCNSCAKRRYGCSRPGRMLYLANSADAKASGIRSESRRGFDMGQDKALAAAALINEGLVRGLSPYEISVAYADRLAVSESTVYRLVDAGVGGLANIQLERKVAFRPRKHIRQRSTTKHAKERSYEAFLALGDGRKDTASEMDCIEGRKRDSQCVLTLFQRTTHLQILTLLPGQTDRHVKAALQYLRSLCPMRLWEKLALTVLTDNGGEFSDEDGIDSILGGCRSNPHLFYCDPRRSDQKCSCEKNHSEVRQLLPKGRTPFDELDAWDIAVVFSHVNSNPRKALFDLSPIQMFKAVFKEEGRQFLDALGIEEIPLDELVLKPKIIDIERQKRGLPPISWL